jgi:hypothetical protein
VVVGVSPEQVVSCRRRLSQAGRVRSRCQFRCAAGLERLAEREKRLVGLTEDQVVGVVLQQVGLASGVRAANDRGHAQLAAAAKDLVKRLALDVHPRQHHHVGTEDLTIRERLHVQVHQLRSPVPGQQRGDGDQPERGQETAFARETKG